MRYKRGANTLSSNFMNNQILKSKRSTRTLSSKFINKQILNSKRSQLTIFIIIAIFILAILLIIFYPKVKRIFVPSTPNVQLQNCLKEKLDEAVELVSKNGGSIKPVNGIMYQENKIEYLCYTNQYYQTCVNQQPLLRQHIEREILDYIKPTASECINDLKENLMKRGWKVSSGKENLKVDILPNKIKITLSGISVTKGDTGEKYNEFSIEKRSQLYDLIMLTTSILNWEARYGDSDITTYMLYYPNIKVEKYKQSDGSKIYILTNTNSGDKFLFATRSLSWPAGYGFNQIHKPVSV